MSPRRRARKWVRGEWDKYRATHGIPAHQAQEVMRHFYAFREARDNERLAKRWAQ